MNQFVKSDENPLILVVDDDPALRDVLGKTLMLEGYRVLSAGDGQAAMDVLKQNEDIALILSDVQMHPVSGTELLAHCHQTYPKIPIVLMTAYGTIENAVDALRDGAADYMVKPFDNDELLAMTERFVRSAAVTQDDLIAVDPRSQQLEQVARRVAATEVTVLVSGESGVGKEVVSRFIHRHSARSNGPFVAINCAAIPENMLESVLFGYEKGAYTGAYQSKAGKFEQAQSGTLLLDEITEMDLALQAKLLRVLQEREVERLGGSKVIDLDVRIIATTNRDIRQAVAEGRFREDLFYRLNVFPIHIHPLSERCEDILPIANKMLASYADENDHVQFSASAQRALKSYHWPGNIRELDNVVQRSLILKTGDLINDADIQFEEFPESACLSVEDRTQNVVEKTTEKGLNNDLKAHEHDLIISALNAKNSRKEVAAKLGISPRTLRYKLAKMRDAGVALPV